ncbi:TLE family member 5-like [Gracilinanus agilis]|uniref:TLE family member 5-like n=1 Tax=Gracilinanus agilis TaxID=191870 RepID=UPI001CFEA05B|nr:TLE family member 5-like [Gracilinanus agilis]
MKEEFQFLQAQYHSLKLECEKLASEKTEMQRHYVMYYEMSYGLNLEMHKQAEIVKRLSTICAKIIPFVKQEVSGVLDYGRRETAKGQELLSPIQFHNSVNIKHLLGLLLD